MREQFGGWANENYLVSNFKSQEQASAEPHFPRDALPDAWLHNAAWVERNEVPMFPDQVIL